MSCTEAQKQAAKKYYERNKDKCIKATLDWQLQNKERDIKNKRTWRQINPDKILQSRIRTIETMLYHSAKTRALKTNLEFNITKEDIKIPLVCPYLKQTITKQLGYGRCKTNPSIDRIDNNKGYTKDNIQVISDQANRMKTNATKDELIQFAKSILEMEGYTILDRIDNY